jgi:methylenetetrahydrofolate reductase (NADPH)
MFFDNEIFYSFIDNIRKEGINVPVIPGLMPVTSTSMLDRIVFLSGNSLPSKFMKMVDKYSSDPLSFREAGIEYATKQAEEIYENGFNAVHIYSMNKPDVAEKIQYNLLDVIK